MLCSNCIGDTGSRCWLSVWQICLLFLLFRWLVYRVSVNEDVYITKTPVTVTRMNNTISTRGMHKLQMRLLKATNIHSKNSFIINNFVMKCIKNIFYFLRNRTKKSMCICSCACPFKWMNGVGIHGTKDKRSWKCSVLVHW